jgi:hypothetical protein
MKSRCQSIMASQPSSSGDVIQSISAPMLRIAASMRRMFIAALPHSTMP